MINNKHFFNAVTSGDTELKFFCKINKEGPYNLNFDETTLKDQIHTNQTIEEAKKSNSQISEEDAF